MNRDQIRLRVALLPLSLLTAGLASAAPTIDGIADNSYGLPTAWQTVQTGFGNNTLTDGKYANGSELDTAYGTISGGVLYLHLAGNLESNGNRLWIFVDSATGGQNRLRGDNGGPASLLRMGDSGGPNGLKFDSAFSPDHVFSLNGAFDGGAGDYRLYVDYCSLPDTFGGTSTYLGAAAAQSSGSLSGGFNLNNVLATIDNSNTGGVGAGSTSGQYYLPATKGVEMAIPLAQIGNPTGPVKVSVIISNGDGSFLSNQFLGTVGYNGATVNNFGEPRGVDLGSSAGPQYFWVKKEWGGRLAVFNLSNGGTGLTGVGSFLEFAASGGSVLRTETLPSTGSSKVTFGTNSGNEGQSTISGDGTKLAVIGYDAIAGTSSASSSGVSATAVNRVVALLSETASVDTTTRITDLNQGVRSAYFWDSTVGYAAGGGGVKYFTLGASTTTSFATASYRVAQVFNGQAYCTASTRIDNLGAGLPTTATAFTNIGATLVNGNDYVMVDSSLMFVADESTTTANNGGIQRYVNTGSGWTRTGYVLLASSIGARSLTVTKNAAGDYVIYAISGSGSTSEGKLYSVTCSASTGTFGTPTLLASPATGNVFRGVEFSPLIPNQAPVANADSYSTDEDTTLNVSAAGVLANDTDAENNPLTAIQVAAPTHGSLTLNSNGSFTYIPAADYNGTDSFTYKANDGTADSNTVTVTITVNSVNDAPVLASIGNQTGDELAPLSITLSSTDIDGGAPVYSMTGAPSGATLVGNAFSWTPDETQGPGDYSVTFEVSDGNGGTDSETISIHVNEVNVAPELAAIGSQTTDELATLSLSLSGTDSDQPSQTLTYSMTGAPAGATLTGNAFSWTPDESQGPGTYSVTFEVSDGTLTDTETVSITVNEVNVAPTANAQSVSTDEETAVNITLTGSDSDLPAQTLSYAVGTGPAHGTLSGTEPNLVYTPNTNFAGSDSFTFTVSDGTATSAPATVSITVSDVNDIAITVFPSPAPNFFGSPSFAPYRTNAMNSLENGLGNIGTRGTAPDAYEQLTTGVWSDITVTNFGFWLGQLFPSAPFDAELGHRMHFGLHIVGNGAQFSLSQLDYDMSSSDVNNDLGFVGSFGNGDVYSASRRGINYGPDRVKGGGDDLVYSSGESATNLVDELMYVGIGNGFEAVAPPGTPAEAVQNTRCYIESLTPLTVSTTYKLRDGLGGFLATGTGSIVIESNNNLPVAIDQSVSVDEDASVNVTLTATDADNEPLTYSVVTGPLHGTLSGTAPNLVYTPNADYAGPDTFTFKATDCVGDSNIATVSITVNPVNDAPELGAIGNRTVDELVPLSIALSSTDIDGGAPIYGMTGEPAGATLSGNTFSWTPAEDQGPGDYSVTFEVSDGNGGTDSETISIHVNEVNVAPELGAVGDQTVDELTPLSLTLSATDSDLPAQTLTYSMSGAPAGATLTGNTFSWTPDESQGPGDYTVTFEVSDGTTTDTESITIHVNEVNSDPILDTIGNRTVDELQPLTITLNATDSDLPANTLTYSVDNAPAGATLTGNVFTWTPDESQGPGDYEVTFIVSDGTSLRVGGVDTETITIHVNEVNVAPMANAQSVSTDEETAVNITLTGSDSDLPAQSLSYAVGTGPAHGTLSGTEPNLVYTPNANFAGSDSFTFTVSDGIATSAPATVSITVNDINDIAITVFPSPAPNFFGSPTFGAYRNNALNSLENNLGNIGSRATAPDAYEQLTTGVWSDLTVTNFGFWLGQLFPSAPFDAELGHRMHFGLHIVGNGAQFSLSQLDYDMSSSDVNNDLGFVGSFGSGDVYSASRVGINYGPDRVKGGGDDFVYNSGESATNLVDELMYVGIGNGYEAVAPPGTPAEAVQNTRCYIESLTPLTVSTTYKLRDGLGGFLATGTGSVLIQSNNNLPVANDQSVSVDEDASVNMTLTATDADNEPLTYSVVTGPLHGTLSGTAPNLVYTPNADYAGPDSFTFKATDCVGDSNVATVSITVNPVNDAPELGAIGNRTVDELAPLVITLSSNDIDGGAPIYGMTGEPAGATLSGNVFSWTPDENQGPGDYTVTFEVSDGNGGTDSESITIHVNEVNVAPELGAVGDQTVDELTPLSMTLSATDSDLPAQTLTYSMSGAPAGATLTGNTFSWTPTEEQGPGTYSITFTVDDGNGGTDSETITVTVNEVNVDPTLDAIGDKSVDELDTLTFSVTGSDTDLPAQTLTYSATGLPTGATFTGGTFSWTPTEDQGPGTYSVTFTVDDGNGGTDSETITITVNEVNVNPELAAIGNQTVDELQPVTITLSATDADLPAQTLTYSGSGLPVGSSLTGNTFTWTPIEGQGPGTYTVTFTVDDGSGGTDSETITITVNEVNSAPVLDPISNQAVAEGDLLSFTATASDPDLPANALTFSLIGAPVGASINPSTGEFSWTPTYGQSGTYTFTVKVTDDGTPSLSDEQEVTVVVSDATTTVSGTVDLQDYVPGPTGVPITIELYQSNVLVGTASAILSPTGEYTFTTAVTGVTDVIVKASHWLAKSVSVDLTPPAVSGVNYSLINGDVDGDNEIGPADFGILSASFGSSFGDLGYVLEADLDGDGEVGPSDFGILSANYGLQGD